MNKAQYVGFLCTPPLWTHSQFDLQQFEFPNVSLDLFEPKPMPDNIRLGHQMEHVFKQLIEHSGAYDMLVQNLQISRDNITLGEIDFILKNKKSNKLIHVELTYKFYIILPDIAQPIHRLIGPNRRDSFFQKTEKIKNFQTPLLHTIEGGKALSEHNIDHAIVEHQCCFKAQLFHQYGSKTAELGTLNDDCLVGLWIKMEDFKKDVFIDNQFYIPTKSEWVIIPHHQIAWKSYEEILIKINVLHLKEFAPMLWMKTATNIEKLFVVWW